MKKITLLLLSVIFLLGVTACGSEKSSSTAPSVDELLANSMKANKEVKSLSQEATVNTKITVSQGETKQEQNMDITTKADIINEPFKARQEIKMPVSEMGEQTIIQYLTEEGIYSNINGQWVKVPDEVNEQFKTSIKESANLDSQIEQFKSMSKYLKLKEEKEQYVLTGDIPGESIKEMAQTILEKAASGNTETLAAMEQLDIKSMNLVYTFNKKTSLPISTVVKLQMGMEQDGQKVDMDLKMNSKFSNFNGVDDITVPKEALNSTN
ncbi:MULTISPECIES: DUF6612 family protein [Bacillus]|uniref:DUF6612 family protein n=1 Tax=Bacillus TaxID=1386 RepID=UPI0002E50288|nr:MULTISPECIES: DUF6612 family protein [Bacillus]